MFLLVCAGLLLLWGCKKGEPTAGLPLLCYVGGTMRPAMEELVRMYESETGQPVDIDYGDSGTNLIKIQTRRRGDLYVAHDPFLGALRATGFARKGWTVAALTPVIVVPKGNPHRIEGLGDLAREDIKLGLTDADYSTLGHICPVMFDRAGLREQIERNVATRMKMGGQVANAVAVGGLDAGIVWNAVAYLRRHSLDAITINPTHLPQPDVDAVTGPTYGRIDMSHIGVFVATLTCSEQPEAARAFAEFMASARGRKVFAEHGFSPARRAQTGGSQALSEPGQPLRLYCGAGLRPAIADVVEAFRKETGVEVECDYAGSGMHISRLRLDRKGDLFMPGDVWYVEQLEKEGLVESKTMVSYFVPVILVRKGNPKGIRTLEDLARPRVRLGLGDAERCQIGRLSQRIFQKNNINADALTRNLVYASHTVNMLGVQIEMERVDAVIVWDAIAAYYAEEADVVPIPLEQNEISHVAIAVLKSSRQKAVAYQFVDYVVSDEGKAIFAEHHYLIDPPK